ncbi:MAG: ArsR family transcriptional regulator [Rhodocyclales bacterium GWA2_65_20]|nr:MAG: ArsR family transcriptional regulator [Rhodocyclales bacterium GWA2_65_20]
MASVRDRGEVARKFIIENVQKHPLDIVKVAAEKFDCSRQAVHKHIHRLIEEGAITETGKTRNKVYGLAPLVKWAKSYAIPSKITEDQVWIEDVSPSLGPMAANVLNIWHYGFTEMFNNALEHSGASSINVEFQKNAASTDISIYDDGVGIFKKIQAALDLLDERHSVLELAKGKFTTDPANHSGEGIFFSSRMFDDFTILSGSVYFSHEFNKKEDWILQSLRGTGGTMVRMELHNHTARTTKKVFDKFSVGEDYGFTKTVVPVKLTQYGDDNLVSRSQAKRLLARVEKFKIVVLDFSRVASIGQAFADEVFRVFVRRHPEIEITPINAGSEVKRMISRAQLHGAEDANTESGGAGSAG